MPSKRDLEAAIRWDVISADDIAYHHSVFVQCFLPVRALKEEKDFWQVAHGNVSLAIQTGRLIDPSNRHHFERREVPSGPKARLLFAYINDQAIRHKSPDIDMGNSLREFMTRNGIPIGGQNGKEIVRQAKNIAASDIMLGGWGETTAAQGQMKIAGGVSFWLERDLRQGTLWQPTMVLSREYFAALQERRVPLDFRALVALQANPRAMDIYAWLAYRLYNLHSPVKIPFAALHPVFGHGIKQRRHFKERFKEALLAAHRCYPEAMVSLEGDYLLLRPSPPAVPRRHEVSHTPGLLPRR